MGRRGFGYWGIAESLCFDGEGGGAGAGAGDGGAGGGSGDGDKVTMTKTELDTLISGRVAAAVKQATKNAGGGTSEEERKELEQLRKDREERERKELERKGEYEAALKRQAESIQKEKDAEITKERTERETLERELRGDRIGAAILGAAGKYNAVNPDQVRLLLDSSIKLDDQRKPVVIDAEGQPRFVGANPMTPEQLVKEFLDQNPHMVRSNAGEGGGAGEGKSKTGDVSEAQTLEAEIAELEKKYQTTRDMKLVTQIGKKNEQLRALKAKK